MKKTKSISFYRGSIVLMLLFVLLGGVAMPAHAQGTTTTLDGQVSCEALGGTWTQGPENDECQVDGVAIASDDTLIISGVNLRITSALDNDGTIIIEQGFIYNDGYFYNNGTININQDAIVNNGTLTNNGTINIGELVDQNSSVGIGNLGAIINNGAITIDCGGGIFTDEGATFSGNAVLDVCGGLSDEASCQDLGGTWTLGIDYDVCQVSSLTIAVDDAFMIFGVNKLGVELKITGNLTNYGTIIIYRGSISNEGTFNNSGTIDIFEYAILNQGTFTNNGTINILDNFNEYSVNGITNDGGTFTNNGTISTDCGAGFGDNGGTFSGTPVVDVCDTDNDGVSDVDDAFPFDPNRAVNCSPGYYGAFTCVPAEPGYFVDTNGATAQTMCAVGYTSEAGATECYLITNNPPVANDDSYSTNEDTALVEATVGTLGDGVLANDTDADTEPLSAVRDTWTTNGALVFNSDGSFIYTPNANYCGADSFTYHANDLTADSNIATVDIHVVCVNNAPVADNDSKSTDEDTPVNVDVQANDSAGPSNEDQTLITFNISNPANGTATINLNGTVTYAPDLNFFGTDTFDYVVCDNGGLCDTATVTITVNPVNDAPVADAGDSYSGNEGAAIAMGNASASDPDAGDTLTYAWSVNSTLCSFNNASALNPNLTCSDNGSYTATLKVSDGTGSVSSDASVTINNVAPTASLGNNGPIDEGSSATVSFSGTFDPSSNDTTAGFHYAFDCNGGLLAAATYASSGMSASTSCAFADNGSQTVSAKIMDKDGGSNEYTTTVVVNNVAPTLGAISVNMAMVQINTAINTSANFTDPGTLDTHSATWDWGDTNTSTDSVAQGSGSVNGSHEYNEPGVYTVKLTVTDKDSAVSNESVYEFVVVYDPSGGFVTGGGWIDSPVNSDYQYMQVDGKATFGFVAKYKKGANLPDGNTQFQFKAGDLNFQSSSYKWLVVASNRAQFKGEGTINGEGSYNFMITADDGNPDTFRIKIWYLENDIEVIVYDNGSQQSLGGGSIVVHK